MTASGKSVDEMIMSLPRSEQAMVKRFRMLIQECLPFATECGYYDMNIPFYRRHRLICFIWPSSIPWGSRAEAGKEKGVSLGFNQGNLMSNENGILQAEGRKQVYVMHFRSLKDINDDQVRALLFEAGMIDDMFGEKKKGNKIKKAKL